MSEEESEGDCRFSKRKITNDLRRAYMAHEFPLFTHVEPFAELILDNPSAAIDQIVDTYNDALDNAYTSEDGKNHRGFIEANARGPLERIPIAFYNAIGVAYPYLERESRDKALGKLLDIFDNRNYMEINGTTAVGHTPHIHEPLLLADITIARPLYWPGLEAGKRVVENHASFEVLHYELIDERGLFRRGSVDNEFLTAYALLRSDSSPFGEEYVTVANAPFLDRTLQGITAMRFSRSDSDKGMQRLKELLPVSVHDRVTQLREEKDWTDHKLFR